MVKNCVVFDKTDFITVSEALGIVLKDGKLFTVEGKECFLYMVRCCVCDMSMLSYSDNALTDGEGIYCRDCAGVD